MPLLKSIRLCLVVLTLFTAFHVGYRYGLSELCTRETNQPSRSRARQPNFIIFLADDMGYGDLSYFGHPTIHTPRIDRMIYEGKQLKNHYTCPMCTPTRGSILTGRLPIRTGLYNGIGFPNVGKFITNAHSSSNQTFDLPNRKILSQPQEEDLYEIPSGSKCHTNRTEGLTCSRYTKVFYPESKYGLSPKEITIAEALKEVGYTSAIIGKWHLGVGSHPDNFQKYLPLQQGFDRFWGMPYSNDMGCPPGIGEPCGRTSSYAPQKWNPIPLYLDNQIIEQPTNFSTFIPRELEESIRFIREAHQADKPFFLLYATVMPHVPLFSSPEFVGSSARGVFGDVIHELDASIGKILDELENLEIHQDTMSVFMSDNGPFPVDLGLHGGSSGLFAGGKGTTWEGGIRSPAVVHWPSVIQPKTIMQGISCAWDLFTTILSIAGAKIPVDRIIDGIDLSSVLFHGAQTVRECQNFYSQKYLMATRCGGFKVHWFTRDALNAPVIQDPPLLYNVNVDPSESSPLLNSKYSKIIERAKAYKKQFEAEFKPAPSLFEYSTLPYQPCCCKETNCTCQVGYTCNLQEQEYHEIVHPQYEIEHYQMDNYIQYLIYDSYQYLLQVLGEPWLILPFCVIFIFCQQKIRRRFREHVE